MPYLDKDGVSMYYSDEGRGKPLVFLHGLSGRSDNWLYQRRYFSSNYRVICPDLPGHGLSEGEHLHFSQYRDVVLSLMDYLNLGRVSLCGLQSGARVAMAIAAHQPARIAKLVVVNAYAYLLKEDRDLRVGLFDLLSGVNGASIWAKTLIGIMGLERDSNIAKSFLNSASTMNAEHIRRVFMQMVDMDLRLDLFNIRARTLLLSGGMDGYIPSYCMPEIYNEIPLSEHVYFPFLGHLPYLEDPMIFNSRVARFLHLGGELH